MIMRTIRFWVVFQDVPSKSQMLENRILVSFHVAGNYRLVTPGDLHLLLPLLVSPFFGEAPSLLFPLHVEKGLFLSLVRQHHFRCGSEFVETQRPSMSAGCRVLEFAR